MLTPKTVLVALGACAAIWAGSVESSFAGESPFVLAFYQAEHPEQDPGTLRTPPVACPDTSTFQFNNTISGASPSLAASSANGGLPTCGAYVIQSAIDLCLEHSARTSVFDQWGQWFSQGSAVLAGLATGIAAAVGTSGTSLAAVGVGTLLLTNGGTAVGKILPSAPPQPQVQSMITAGIEYVVLNSQATPTMTTYAGLW
ncbi:MAG TPA: hypothetical protein VHX64_17495, partial [Caulobacteraceae bacterium]|nr:hypothetical protein [Caulobacteraceae bacterium]